MDKNLATLEIRFENCSFGEAQTKAKELRDYVMDASQDAKVDIVKDSQTTMDFGATLILILGAPAIVAVAKGISVYLTRAGGTVTITPDGGVETKGIAGDDVAKIVAALSKRK
jgi:hypothetical protein